MKYRTRQYYTDSQKALMWARWKEGWTLQQIGQLFDRPHTSIQQIFVKSGGIRPPERWRSSAALTLTEREEISRALVAGESIRSVAARLGRAPSTISRELKRNGGRESYRAAQADSHAWNRALRPKRCKLTRNRGLARLVADKLRMLWSPAQIAGWLKHTYPCDESLHVSHETIYRSLFIQARGALKRELLEHLRRTRGMRRSRHYTQKTAIHGQIVDAVSISERPASVEDRAVPGHWEGDLVFGSNTAKFADSGQVGERQKYRWASAHCLLEPVIVAFKRRHVCRIQHLQLDHQCARVANGELIGEGHPNWVVLIHEGIDGGIATFLQRTLDFGNH